MWPLLLHADFYIILPLKLLKLLDFPAFYHQLIGITFTINLVQGFLVGLMNKLLFA
ncbi:hypothetical protein D3C74_484170 [compost metagenome]